MAASKQKKIAKAFGAALKKARLAAGLTQEELAEKAHSSATYISLLENGHQQPALAVLMALEEALNLQPGELVRRTKGD